MADSRSSIFSASSAQHLRALRRTALGTLAAELGHELQGPLNLFRSAKERLERGTALDTEDLALLSEELERLSGLTARLRELARRAPLKTEISARELVEAALHWPPLDQSGPDLELELDAAASVRLSCDVELLAGAVRELIDNALEACESRVGVRFQMSAVPGICVWDDGPGLSVDVARAMAWGMTTKPAAAGIGLCVALRAARAHGMSLHLERTATLTEAWLRIPSHAWRAPTGAALR